MKTIRKIFTSAVIALTAVSCLSVTASATTVGDVNGDGKVNIQDALVISKTLVGNQYSYDENKMDLNSDGVIDYIYLTMIFEMISN